MKKFFIIIASSIIFLFSSSFCFAATILTDGFETYATGTLNGQGSWSADASMIVENTFYSEGLQAVSTNPQSGAYKLSTKVGSEIANGSICVDISVPNSTPWARVELFSGATQVFIFGANDQGGTCTDLAGCYYDGSSDYTVIPGSELVADTFSTFCAEWRVSDHKARYNFDGGTWTDWYNGLNTAWTYLDKVGLVIYNSPGNYISYFDNIIEADIETPPAIPTSGLLTFPWVLITILAVFILCFIIDKGGARVIALVQGMYRYKF